MRLHLHIVCGYGSISQWLLPHPNPVVIAHWGQGIFVISLAVNIVVTALIAVRIWYVVRLSAVVLSTLTSHCAAGT